MLPERNGVGALPERSTINGTDGGDRAEGAGEMRGAASELRSSRVSSEVGNGGYGFIRMAGMVTDEFNAEGLASRMVASGWEPVFRAVLPACKGASGEVVRTRGSGSTIYKHWAAQSRDPGGAMPPESFA